MKRCGRLRRVFAAAALCCSAAAAAEEPLFNVIAAPAPGQAQVALAPLEEDAPPALWVVEAGRLRAYTAETPDLEGGVAAPYLTAPLPDGASCFDITDIDGDGRNELLFLAGRSVMARELEPEEDADAGSLEPRLLFEADHLYVASGAAPAPCVLGLERAGEFFVLLPLASGLEVRKLDGKVEAAFPAAAADHAAAPGAAFEAWSVPDAPVGGDAGLEFRVRQRQSLRIDLPQELRGLQRQRELPRGRRVGPSQLADAAGRASAQWPWFALRAESDAAAEDNLRVHYAPAPPDFRDTMVVIRSRKVGPTPPPLPEAARLYPGMLGAPPGALPDFNGDGFTDLLLWLAPRPGRSIDSIARAAVENTWPIHLRVHLYLPERRRYDARPAGRIDAELPAVWLLLMQRTGSPLRNAVFEDFDGDGRTDAAWSTSATDYAAWRYDDGFGARADFEHEFPEPILRVERTAPMSFGLRRSIVLRGEERVYWLLPTESGQPARP